GRCRYPSRRTERPPIVVRRGAGCQASMVYMIRSRLPACPASSAARSASWAARWVVRGHQAPSAAPGRGARGVGDRRDDGGGPLRRAKREERSSRIGSCCRVITTLLTGAAWRPLFIRRVTTRPRVVLYEKPPTPSSYPPGTHRPDVHACTVTCALYRVVMVGCRRCCRSR